MHANWDFVTKHSGFNWGPFLVITITLDASECADAAIVTKVGAKLAALIPYVGDLVQEQFNTLASQIVERNEGFGVIVTMSMPMGGVGVPSNTVASRKPVTSSYSVLGSFDAIRVGLYDNAQSQVNLSDGYSRLLLDLNKGAGGKYVYFEVRSGQTSLISAVAIQHGSSKTQPPPVGYVQVPTDLNAGAGGEYIYLSYMTGGSPAIGGFLVYATSDQNSVPPSGWTSTGIDLNRGAGGAYIYLCFVMAAAATTGKKPPFVDYVRTPVYWKTVQQHIASNSLKAGEKTVRVR
jgi:hypothetical protein